MIKSELNRPNQVLLELYYVGLILIIATMPFPMRGNNLAMLFTVICWLFLFFSNSNWKNFLRVISKNRTAMIMILFSLLFVFSSLIHFETYNSLDDVLKNIEKRIHLLAYPVILSGVVFLPQIRIKRLLMLFVYIVLFALLLSLILGLIQTLRSGSIEQINTVKGTFENNFKYHRLGSYIGMHAVFFAAYTLFAFCILLIQFLWRRRDLSHGQQAFHLLSMTFMVFMMYLLSSITISIILLLILLLILVYYFYTFTKSKKTIVITLTIIFSAGIIFGYNIYRKLEAKENLFQYDLSVLPDRAGTEESNWNALNIRLAITDISTKAVKDYWLLGVGPGNMRKVLDSYYQKYNFVFGMLDHFHPHNQYIHSFLVLGIVGFLVLLWFSYNICRTSFRNNDLILGSLSILFILFSLADSTLSVNKGIMFFSFFISFLTFLEPTAMIIFTDTEKMAGSKKIE